jgi:hypothetical protein
VVDMEGFVMVEFKRSSSRQYPSTIPVEPWFKFKTRELLVSSKVFVISYSKHRENRKKEVDFGGVIRKRFSFFTIR